MGEPELEDGLPDGALRDHLRRRNADHARRALALAPVMPNIGDLIAQLTIKVYLETLLLELECLGTAKLELGARVEKLLDKAEAAVPAQIAINDQAEAAERRRRLLGGSGLL